MLPLHNCKLPPSCRITRNKARVFDTLRRRKEKTLLTRCELVLRVIYGAIDERIHSIVNILVVILELTVPPTNVTLQVKLVAEDFYRSHLYYRCRPEISHPPQNY